MLLYSSGYWSLRISICIQSFYSDWMQGGLVTWRSTPRRGQQMDSLFKYQFRYYVVFAFERNQNGKIVCYSDFLSLVSSIFGEKTEDDAGWWNSVTQSHTHTHTHESRMSGWGKKCEKKKNGGLCARWREERLMCAAVVKVSFPPSATCVSRYPMSLVSFTPSCQSSTACLSDASFTSLRSRTSRLLSLSLTLFTKETAGSRQEYAVTSFTLCIHAANTSLHTRTFHPSLGRWGSTPLLVNPLSLISHDSLASCCYRHFQTAERKINKFNLLTSFSQHHQEWWVTICEVAGKHSFKRKRFQKL